jgi:hypothetical protein
MAAVQHQGNQSIVRSRDGHLPDQKCGPSRTMTINYLPGVGAIVASDHIGPFLVKTSASARRASRSGVRISIYQTSASRALLAFYIQYALSELQETIENALSGVRPRRRQWGVLIAESFLRVLHDVTTWSLTQLRLLESGPWPRI